MPRVTTPIDTLRRPCRSELLVAAERVLDVWYSTTDRTKQHAPMQTLHDAVKAESARLARSTMVERKDA